MRLLLHLTWVVKLRQVLRMSSRFYHEGQESWHCHFLNREDRGKVTFAEWRLRVQLLTCHVWDAVLICCHIINFPKTVYLKTANIYYLAVSVSQELGSTIAGWFWLRVSREVAVKISTGAAALCEGLPGAGGPLSKMAPSYCRWPEASVPPHIDLPLWVSSHHGSWLSPQWEIQKSKAEVTMPFMT